MNPDFDNHCMSLVWGEIRTIKVVFNFSVFLTVLFNETKSKKQILTFRFKHLFKVRLNHNGRDTS